MRTRRAPSQIRHGRLSSRSPLAFIARRIVIGFAVLAVSAGAVITVETASLAQTFGDHAVEIAGEAEQAPPPFLGAFEGGFTMLVVGTDNDAAQGDDYGERSGVRNDVNILLHVSSDHHDAVVVSLPRDLVIPHPECVDPETGDRFDSMGAQPLNVAYGRGGLACVAATISALTGLPIQYAAATSFNGVIALTDAVGGVEVRVTEPMVDADSGVNLPEGRTTVAGQTALAFLRNRHGIGNGSDLSRIGGQQQYLSSLLRTIRSDSTLSDPAKLYALAQAAGHNIIPSTSLGSADTMVSLALTLKDVDLSSIVFVQYPVTAYVEDTNKVQPAFALAEELFTRILADEPVVLPDDSTASGTTLATPAPSSPENAGPAMTEAPSATVGPAAIQGLNGQRADQETCASGFSG